MTGKDAPSDVKNEKTVPPREKLLQRLPSNVEPSQALRDIHTKLATAREFFEHHGDGGRLGVFRAVLDVVAYFADLGIPRATLEPLSAVAMAIVDADSGTESPIFRPDRGRGGGKPPTSIGQLEFDGHLVTITECCVRHCKAQGMTPYVMRGCELAAKMVNSRWPKKATPTGLREKRERVQQSARTSPDRILLEQAMSSQLAECDPLAYARHVLEHDWVGPPPS